MAELPENPGDAEIRAILARVRRIAVVGLSPKPHRDSHRVAAYMQRVGYEIVPVYPRESEILGARVYAGIGDVEGSVDMVDVFRRPEELSALADEILAAKAANDAVIWFQLDCVDPEAIAKLTNAGRTVVYDRCLMVEHARLR